MSRFSKLIPALLLCALMAPAQRSVAQETPPAKSDGASPNALQDPSEPPVLHGEEAERAAADAQLDPSKIAKMADEVRQVPLTEDMVNRFIASFKEMREVGKKFPETKLPDQVINEAPGSEFKYMAADKREAMTKVAVDNGFKDIDDWSVVGSSIAMSYTYALQGKKPGEVTKAVAMHIAEVKEDKSLTAEQKDAQIAQLEDFAKKLGKLEPMPENYALVEQMKAKVAPIMSFE